MKKLFYVIFTLLLTFIMFSCGRSEADNNTVIVDPNEVLKSEEIAEHNCDKHGHVYSVATCVKASTCYYCDETEGELGGHDKTKATCLKKSFCTVCEKEFGEFGEHDFTKSSCSAPSCCAVCGLTSGSTESHIFKDATCVTPKICKVCMKTTGSSSGHKLKGGSCTEGKTCSRCSYVSEPLGHKMREGTCTKDSVCKDCDYVEKAAGHKFESGKCTVCGKTKQQSEDESKIEEQNKQPEVTTEKLNVEPLLEKANEILNLCISTHSLCQTTIDDIYGTGKETAPTVVEQLSQIVKISDEMMALCGSDSRLANTKTYIASVKKTVEKYVTIKNFSESTILKTVVDMRAACTEAKNASNKLIKHLESLS